MIFLDQRDEVLLMDAMIKPKRGGGGRAPPWEKFAHPLQVWPIFFNADSWRSTWETLLLLFMLPLLRRLGYTWNMFLWGFTDQRGKSVYLPVFENINKKFSTDNRELWRHIAVQLWYTQKNLTDITNGKRYEEIKDLQCISW